MRGLSPAQIEDASQRIKAESDRQRNRRATAKPDGRTTRWERTFPPRDPADDARWAAETARQLSLGGGRETWDGGDFACHVPAAVLEELPGLVSGDADELANLREAFGLHKKPYGMWSESKKVRSRAAGRIWRERNREYCRQYDHERRAGRRGDQGAAE
jgi:hypothetical protein